MSNQTVRNSKSVNLTEHHHDKRNWITVTAPLKKVPKKLPKINVFYYILCNCVLTKFDKTRQCAVEKVPFTCADTVDTMPLNKQIHCSYWIFQIIMSRGGESHIKLKTILV